MKCFFSRIVRSHFFANTILCSFVAISGGVFTGVLFHSLSTGVFCGIVLGGIFGKESQYSLQNNKVFKSTVFIAVILIFLSILFRIASLSYLDASDNYNNVSIKAIFDNGVSSYKTSQFTTYFSVFLVKIFGFRNEILRIPSLLYSGITVFLLFFVGRKIHNAVGLLSVFLFAVSPWSIALSRLTRDYSFDALCATFILFLIGTILLQSHEKTIRKDMRKILLIGIFFTLIAFLNTRPQQYPLALFSLLGVFFLPGIPSTFVSILKRKIILSLGITLLLGSIFFLINRPPFSFGLHPNIFYWNVFFSSAEESPWQWFYGYHIPMMPLVLLCIFPFLTFSRFSEQQKRLYGFLCSAFSSGLLLFSLKFESHLNYSPTRYVYYLFPIFCLLFGTSLWILSEIFRKQYQWKKGIFFLLFFSVFLHPTALRYAIFPAQAHEETGAKKLMIDNIGIGRYEVEAVAEFIKKNLSWTPEIPFVVDGKYNEYILLLKYPIDPNRILERPEGWTYDTGKNLFVEASFFEYHQLETALAKKEFGYFITGEHCLTRNGFSCWYSFEDRNFFYKGRELRFLRNINGIRIYSWGTAFRTEG